MKFSEQWLRTFVNPGLGVSELADALTMSGIEVEAVDGVAPPFDGVVVAEVVDVSKHPGADRLTVCRVNAGDSVLQVVCGAPNVRGGLRVPLARVGARLPAITIKQAKVRGIESSGMLCSAKELGLASEAAGLLELAGDAPVGCDIRQYLALDDHVYTTKPTPNRGDCLSLLGMAREVAAITGTPLSRPQVVLAPGIEVRVPVAVEAVTACPLYLARVVHGVNARTPTPRWMVQRLERSGLRSISAIVDATNYVMLEMGQPLHAFDASKIDSEIRVRFAKAGEKLTLLNEQEVALGPEWLVIADRARPLALAGIMGGLESAVTLDTQNIVLESAFFAPEVIAGKSRVMGLGSDSSYRFERGVDFGGTLAALDRVTQLVIEICGGSAGPVNQALGQLPARQPVRLRLAKACKVLGMALDATRVANVFERLKFEFRVHDDVFLVTPPSYRFDISIEQDLIEEIARIVGYEQVPANQPLSRAVMLPVPEARASAHRVRRQMVARDYQEIITYSFVDRQWEQDFCGNNRPVSLANPIASQLNVMRSSLIGSLVDSLKLNLSRQQDRVRLFEIGRCFVEGPEQGLVQDLKLAAIAYGDALGEQWGIARRRVDFYDVKGDLETLLDTKAAVFDAFVHPALHPTRAAKICLNGEDAGWLGELHPSLCHKYEIPYNPIVFEINLALILRGRLAHFSGISRQPMVRRDISIEVDAKVSANDVLDALRRSAPDIVTDIALFDVYRGKGIDSDKKSIAFRILMQDTVRTLTDAETEAAQQKLINVLQEQFLASLRK